MKTIILILLFLGGTVDSFTQEAFAINSLVSFIDHPKVKNHVANNEQIIPFQLSGGFIMVHAAINGKPSSCIFDTGAPSIILNKDEDLMSDTNDYGISVTGKTKIKSTVVQSFQMGKLKKKNIEAMEIDISHIEEMKNLTIDGIIGVEALKGQEVLIDYKNEEIRFLPKKTKKKSSEKEKIATVSFYMKNQLPVIKVKIGKKRFYFGVDTGAEVNVLNLNSKSKLSDFNLKAGEPKMMTSVSQEKSLSESVIFDQFKVGGQTINDCQFVYMDFAAFNLNNEIQLDGILGYPFLKEHLISFDFRRSKLNFWKASDKAAEPNELPEEMRYVMSEK